MSDRPNWNQWILQKNAEFEAEELRKSDNAPLEKIWSASMLGVQGTHAAKKRAMAEQQNREARGQVHDFNVPKEHLPLADESKESHSKRVVSSLKQKFPKVPHEKHMAAADRAWKRHHGND